MYISLSYSPSMYASVCRDFRKFQGKKKNVRPTNRN